MSCPFCQEAVDDAEPARCPGCEAPYHAECWACTGACGACGALEEEAEAPVGAAPDPVARPLPGFESYDIILGGGFAGQTPTSTRDPGAGEVVEAEIGTVLLRVEGRKGSVVTLLVVAGLFPVLLLMPFFMFDIAGQVGGSLPFTNELGTVNGSAVVLVAALVLGLGLVVRTVFETAPVTFTERGVLSRNSHAASFMAWEEIEGYREAGGHILLESPRGRLSIPTVDAERRGQVLQLLNERAIARFD